jgi:hypothetical protein
MSALVESFAKLFVPIDLLKSFEVVEVKEEGEYIYIELTERDIPENIPKEIFKKGKVVLNGYMNKLDIQTFPAQGKEVFLRINRRKWKLKGETTSYSNRYEIIEKEMKSTKEFGAFLKEIGRE